MARAMGSTAARYCAAMFLFPKQEEGGRRVGTHSMPKNCWPILRNTTPVMDINTEARIFSSHFSEFSTVHSRKKITVHPNQCIEE